MIDLADLAAKCANVLQESGQLLLSASDILKRLEEKGDCTQDVNAATIQKLLESAPDSLKDRITVWHSPGGETKFQWIWKSPPSPNSLAGRLF
jgi:hypothetical protein